MLVTGIAIFSLPFNAVAVTTSSRTIPVGTKIRCVIAQNVDSRTTAVGAGFLLRVDDPAQPALDGAWIKGHVIDVQQPGGLDRARIGFILSNVRFKDGSRDAIHAQVLGQNVTNYDPVAVKREADKFLLPKFPVGTVTPGPIAFQITFSPGAKPSIRPTPSGSTGGYIYAEKSNENIVIPAGTVVTIQLTSNLLAQ